MNYRHDVIVSRETIHRIVLRRMGVTFVDVAFYPDHERGTTNGSLCIHGDFGPFEYFWGATGCRYFSDFLAKLNYGYAMGKLLMNRGGGYREDWDSMPGLMKERLLELRRDGSITREHARMLYDYFDGEYMLDSFEPRSYEELLRALEEELSPSFVRSSRPMGVHVCDVSAAHLMFGGDLCDLPTPNMERSEPYFWDEVWPVIVEEIRKLEENLGDWETK